MVPTLVKEIRVLLFAHYLQIVINTRPSHGYGPLSNNCSSVVVMDIPYTTPTGSFQGHDTILVKFKLNIFIIYNALGMYF